MYKAAGGAVLAGALVYWLVALPRIELAKTQRATAVAQVADLRDELERRAEIIRLQSDQLGNVVESERRIRTLLQTIADQGRQQSRAIEEIKRNDSEALDYLRGAVPASIGRLYERATEADPGRYRQQPALQPDSVPPARQATGVD